MPVAVPSNLEPPPLAIINCLNLDFHPSSDVDISQEDVLEGMLNHISNLIGKPYYVDKLTSSKERLSYARILIEVNAIVTLKQCIWLKGPNGIKIEHKDHNCPSSKSQQQWVRKNVGQMILEDVMKDRNLPVGEFGVPGVSNHSPIMVRLLEKLFLQKVPFKFKNFWRSNIFLSVGRSLAAGGLPCIVLGLCSISDIHATQLLSTAEQVSWWPVVWSSYAIPKTSFITWLAVHDRLATKEGLVRVHILSDNTIISFITELD
ncbi:hypothetical protein M9H77_08958 [Catharanthus roseus]|uniref:Uncharacterized protein n=1 Tax=Catharanthus roseus TaxID=4058 RepID=A0ACC0BZ87_CATRO|nr:hypothetical protein M9H77_08958 [Catharanthus roseus]